MRRSRLAGVAWKVLLYLVVAVVLAGVTRDLVLTAALTAGFVAGDSSLGMVLRAHPRPGRPAAGTAQPGVALPQQAPHHADH
jgi:hypothetical protein